MSSSKTDASATTTEESKPKPRSVQKLLKLYAATNSYQDMTDEEITALISYKTEVAAIVARQDLIESQRQEQVNASIAEMEAANKRALEVLETALATPPTFETISEA